MGIICKCLRDEDSSLIKEEYQKIACTVKCHNKFYGIGFLCRLQIPYKMEEILTLITTSQTIGKIDIESNTNIEIYLISNKNLYNIIIDNSRKTYIDEENNITIIEIKKEDGINIDGLLKIDDNISEKDIIQNEISKSIYLLNYDYDTKIMKYE